MYHETPFLLPGGRTLGYAEFGDPAGQPLIASLGLTSRRFYPFDPAIAAAQGVRLIMIDRPGLGLSSPQPERRLADWPADVAALADALGLTRFGLLGAHAGGAYALACAAALPGRVAVLGLAAVPAPPEAGLSPSAGQAARRAAAWVRRVAERQPPITHEWIRANPVKAWQRFHHALPEADGELVRTYGPRYLKPAWMRDHIDELYRQGTAGAEQDDALLAAPWGLDPAAVRTRTLLWHGEADADAPVAAGRYLAGALPDCRATFLPGEGHWFMLARWSEMLAALAAEIG